ncbi:MULTISPECIES: hypothetical protein [Companilactobacillus]|uniref:hypothetical protein n=1 Tax=Companilactobacillus TaxID=2767879 RepID=UPI00070B170B|nr:MULTISPECIES: hypothetical protein [Companilactobacillus]
MKVTYENFSTAQEIVGENIDALFKGLPIFNLNRKRESTNVELIDESIAALEVMKKYYKQEGEKRD